MSLLSTNIVNNKSLYIEKAKLTTSKIESGSKKKFEEINIVVWPSVFKSRFTKGAPGYVSVLNSGVESLKWENSKLGNTIVVPSDYIIRQVKIQVMQEIHEYTILAIISTCSGDVGFELHEYFDELDLSKTYDIGEICYNFTEKNLEESEVFGYAEDNIILLMAKTESGLVEQVYESYIKQNISIQCEESQHLILVNAESLYKDEYLGT